MPARYWVNGGTGNWNSTTNWSASSGGPSGASVPGAADDAFFNNLGNSNCAVNLNAIVLSINVSSGYTSTLTINTNFTLTVTVNITLGASMSIAGAGILVLGSQTNASITSNGVIIPNFRISHVSTGAPLTFTLNDVINCSGNLELGNGANQQNCTINGNSISARGNITLLGNNASLSRTNGTTVLNINGTGNQTLISNNGVLHLDTDINKASGTLTIGNVSNPLFRFGGNKTLRYIAGSVSVFTNTFFDIYEGATLNTAGISWENIRPQTSGTITFTSTFTVVKDWSNNATQTLAGAGFFTSCGTLIGAATASLVLANAITVTNITVSSGTLTLSGGDVTVNNNITCTGALTGAITINWVTTTGTWSGTGQLNTNLVINSPGTVNISSVSYGGGSRTLTRTAGNINHSGTFNITGNCSLGFNSLSEVDSKLSGVNCNANATITMLSPMRTSTFLTAGNVALTFNGSTLSFGLFNLSSLSTQSLNGTTQFRLESLSATLLCSGPTSTGVINVPFIINSPYVNQIFMGTGRYSNFTYIQGQFNTSNIGIVTLSGTVNINGAGLWLPTLALASNTTFASSASFGLTARALSIITAGVTGTFKSGCQYIFTDGLQLIGTAASPVTVRSSVGGVQAKITRVGSLCDVGYCNATDINSGDGLTVFKFKGTLTNTINWSDFVVVPVTAAYTFFA
jgi:hypothetical protein